MSAILDAIPSWFKTTPQGKAMIAERDSEVMAQRKAAALELARLTAAEAKELPPLRAKALAAQKAFKAAEEAVHAARRAAHEVEAVAAHRGAYFDRMKLSAERQLRELAPTAIADFIAELNADAGRIRNSEPDRVGVSRWHPINGTVQTFQSNQPARNKRLVAIRAAIEAAERLKLTPLDGAELSARLDELRDSLPATDVFANEVLP